MGGACCKVAEAEPNPDGSEKDPQTEEQQKEDPGQLRRWAKDGDAIELERLLRRMRRKDINSGARKDEGVPEEEGHTALHYAAQRSQPCVELLVLYGAAVNAKGAGGVTPLHCALEAGRRNVAHVLLEHGANINAKDKQGRSPFLAVLLSGRRRLAVWLLGRSGDALAAADADGSGLTPAAAAARNGWWELLGQLAALGGADGAALNTVSAEGDTALGWVLKYGAAGLLSGEALAGVVGGLLERGASPVVPCFKEHIPPVCLAAAAGNLEVLAALRARGAPLDPGLALDSVRRNALHYAAAKGHRGMAELLMAEGGPGMQPHVTDAGGSTPLHLAALRGHADVALALLERCSDPVAAVMTPNAEGVSTYHLFLQAGPEERSQEGVLAMIEKIGAEGAATPIKTKKGKEEVVVDTPLLLAVGSHQQRVVTRLLEMGHDPNQANAAGDTPLSRCLASATADTAAADGAIFRLLVEKGASPEASSGSCHPLLAICMNPLSRFAEQVVDMLQQRAGGALDWGSHADAQGRGPLHLAALHDNAFMCRYLLESAKLDPNAPSAEGLTPLMYAAWGCALGATKVLLNRRADPRAADPSGRTALAHGLRLDRGPESLAVAAMLLLLGAAPEDCVDGRGEGWLHRAVRYGSSEFVRLWCRYGGNPCVLATTEDAADDLTEALPRGGAGGRRGPAEDYLDAAPVPLEAEEDADDGAWDLGSGKLEGAEGAEGGSLERTVTGQESLGGGAGLALKQGSFQQGAGSGRGSFAQRGSEAGDRLGPLPGDGDAGVGAGQGHVGGGPRPKRASSQGGGGGGMSLTAAASMGRQASGAAGAAFNAAAGSFGRQVSNGLAGGGALGSGRLAPLGGISASGGLAAGPSGRTLSGRPPSGRASGAGDMAAVAAAGFADAAGEYGASAAADAFGLPGDAYGNGTARPVAEAVEGSEWGEGLPDGAAEGPLAAALAEEMARFPSFCRRPSVVEVRRWAKRGAAWFDDELPSASAEGLPPPAALPLPPGDEEEEAEEEAMAAEEEPEVHPALDADAIWRRMLLARLKDRRRQGAAGSPAPPAPSPPPVPAWAAAAAAAASPSPSPFASPAKPLAAAGTPASPSPPPLPRTGSFSGRRSTDGIASPAASPAVAAAAAGSNPVAGRSPSFLDRLTRRNSSSGVPSPAAAAAAATADLSSPAVAVAGGSPALLLRRRSSSSGSGLLAGRPPSGRATSPTAAAAAAAAATPATAVGAELDDWIQEIQRSAESVIADLSRGESQATLLAAAGGGSRAVRSVRSQRGSLNGLPDGAAAAGSRSQRGSLNGLAEAGSRRTGPGPVAESREDGAEGEDDVSSEDSDNAAGELGGEGAASLGGGGGLEGLKDAGIGLVSKLMDKKVAVNDPYYRPGTKYMGVPKYMDETVVNVNPAPIGELIALAEQLDARLARYGTPADEAPLAGADLRERNIKWYNLGLSPSEYPLKPGQWKAALKKAKQAAQAARTRGPRAPGAKPVIRSRKAFFGLPAMPSRPELRQTSALVYAVRLARPSVVAALLEASLQPLNLPDGWGHTPVAYASLMLARDKHSAPLQQQYDLLLQRLPQVNFTYLDSVDGNKGHSLMSPIALAVITGDRSRLAHLVLKCAGSINNSWTLLTDIPTYLAGAWEKAVAKCESRCAPLALAVLAKRIDSVKLCLDLGANPNTFGESRDLKLKAKLAKQWAEDREAARRLADEYSGVLVKAKVGLGQKLARLKRAISNIEIPGLTKPHPWVTPLHLAGRTGQAEVAFLLLRRGALANGGAAVPYAKRTPLQEAMLYARKNFSATNAGARRKHWATVRPAFDDIPPMSAAAAKKEADSKAGAIMRAMVDPTMIALKAVALAAKMAVNFLMEMRKRPIAHHDPALWAAHVLLVHRAPYDLSDAQTAIVLRDVMDNGKWKWLRRPDGSRFKVSNPDWTEAAKQGIDTLKADGDTGYGPMGGTDDPKAYRQMKQAFVARCDETYFGSGGKALHARWSACAEAALAAQRAYVLETLQPAIEGMAHQALSNHVSAAGGLLERTAAARSLALGAAAEALEGGVALSEEGVMDTRPYKVFTPPATAGPGEGGPAPAQAAAAAALRAQAGRANRDEAWGRVMVWGVAGTFLGFPADAELQPMPNGDAELQSLARALADVDTDELENSLGNLREAVASGVEALLAKLQDAQAGLSNLLEIIGIDFLDFL
ncbi:hypothetical protein HYH03_010576 [Edaphochlamys debaryana]|uniref:Poly [ADP-ribose] polymerase n=1 Tax=Edaphochlamys debaryana TaxID=47281 RepID=A0A835XVS6_9CHLO|nr:hypothetical protein HYH03_010576 [Edaphochlamys debaryana]|eukprot:KAG2491133.1 hypothetical protein HYH03_010576 [Edaphochlamys debaryana]